MPTLSIPGARVGVLVSWCGMRGLVTLATAFALPDGFPERDLIVLSAFTVVLGTLVVQGLTIGPLIALLKIQADCSLEGDVARVRAGMLDAALAALAGRPEAAAVAIRREYEESRAASTDPNLPAPAYGQLRMIAIDAERQFLIAERARGRVEEDAFHFLEDELDRAEMHAEPAARTGLDA